MVFVDELGSTIQGHVKKEWVGMFRSILTDGLSIMLSNIQVGKSSGSFLYSPHAFKINFQPDTKIKVIDNFVGPEHHFNFRSFVDIIDNKLHHNQIIDIIGLVVHVGGIIPGCTNNKPNKRRILRLEDLDGKQIDCTIWDVYVDEFNRFLENNSEETDVIIIVQFGKIKGFNTNTISFGTALYATKLYINESIPAINDFKEGMKERLGNDSAKLKLASVSTQTVMTSPTSFFADCVTTTLDELPRLTKERRCATIATIHSVLKDKPWYYIACSKCHYGVTPSIDAGSETSDGSMVKNLWSCRNCKTDVKKVFPRYKIYVRVVDETGSATFVLFDKDVKKLITISAYNMRGVVADCGDQFPEELNDLAGQTALFDYKVTKTWNLDKDKHDYTVTKLTKEEPIVDAFRKVSEKDEDKVVEQEPMTPLPEGEAVVDENSVGVSKDAASATGDGGSKLTVKSTADSPPVKRLYVDVDDEDIVEGSSTRVKRKLVEVKQEKL